MQDKLKKYGKIIGTVGLLIGGTAVAGCINNDDGPDYDSYLEVIEKNPDLKTADYTKSGEQTPIDPQYIDAVVNYLQEGDYSDNLIDVYPTLDKAQQFKEDLGNTKDLSIVPVNWNNQIAYALYKEEMGSNSYDNQVGDYDKLPNINFDVHSFDKEGEWQGNLMGLDLEMPWCVYELGLTEKQVGVIAESNGFDNYVWTTTSDFDEKPGPELVIIENDPAD